MMLLSGYCILVVLNVQAQTLEDYFRVAADNNPGLNARYKEFEAALQEVTQARSLQDPTLSVGYFISPVETRVGPQRARLSLSQMFPWFGTLKAQGDAAAYLADAKYQAFIDARNKLYFQVATAYYPLYELNKLELLEQKNIDILESYKTISTKQFENGNGAMVDVLRADIMLKESQTNLKILKDKERSLKAAFNTVLGQDTDEDVIVKDSLELVQLPGNDLKDSLMVNNPVLKELDYKVSASQAMETAAIKQGLPKLGVSFDYVIVGERSDMAMDDNGKDAIMPMVSVGIPIFRAKYKAAEKKAQLMQESYLLQKEDYTNTIISGYETILFEIRQQQQLIYLYEDQIKESQQILNLLYSAYSNSGKEFEEVLRVQQQLLKYEKMRATALAQYHIALARLNYITAKKY